MSLPDESTPPKRTPRHTPFRFLKRLEEFESAYGESLAREVRKMQLSFLSPDNVLGYTHGTRWRTAPTEEGDDAAEMKSHTLEMEVPFESIAGGDLTALPRYRKQIADQFMKQFMTMMYATVNAATEKTGNIVRAEGGRFRAEHFLEMLDKIEFGVDRNGQVTLPEIHAGPEQATTMLKELSAQGPEFAARVEAIKARKISDALAREQERKARFPKRAEY